MSDINDSVAQHRAARASGDTEPSVARRRSDRISLPVAVQVLGADPSGNDFAEQTRMKQVARYGGSILLRASLGPRQVITLRHLATKKEVQARTVGQLGIQAQAHVYGIAFLQPQETFWGIHFPPFADGEDFLTKLVIDCGVCTRREIVPFNEMELEVFEANDRIWLNCESCNEWTLWKLADCGQAAAPRSLGDGISPPVSDETPPPAYTPLRRYPRVRVNLKGCVALDNEPERVVSVLDMSRGGLRFRTQHKYGVQLWVQVAAPYTIGGANIFQPGRIVWQREQGIETLEYGLKYVRN
jgi:hypothetical protein